MQLLINEAFLSAVAPVKLHITTTATALYLVNSTPISMKTYRNNKMGGNIERESDPIKRSLKGRYCRQRNTVSGGIKITKAGPFLTRRQILPLLIFRRLAIIIKLSTTKIKF